LGCIHNRTTDDPLKWAYDAVRAAPLRGALSIDVPRQHKQPKRKAQVELRSCQLTLKPNTSEHPDRQPVELTLLEVWEPHPPNGLEPLHWRLWSTEAVNRVEQARAVIAFYKLRWNIEDFGRVSKTAVIG